MHSPAKFLILISSIGLLHLVALAVPSARGAEDGLPAVTTATDRHEEYGWSLGLALINSDNTYIDHDERFPVFPLFEYRGKNFSFYPLGISYQLYSSEGDKQQGQVEESAWAFTLHTQLEFGFGERDEEESAIFEDMEEREYGSTAGIAMELSTPIGVFELSANTDIASTSEGSTAAVSYGFPVFMADKLMVVGELGAEYYDRDFSDYFYGVRETEVRADRLAYRADAAVNSFLGYSVFYQISKKWSLIHSARYIKLDDEIVDSTLTTDEDNQLQAMIAITYTF